MTFCPLCDAGLIFPCVGRVRGGWPKRLAAYARHCGRRPDPHPRPPVCPRIFYRLQVVFRKRLYGASEVTNRPSNSCTSVAASASSHSRNAMSLGRFLVAFGQIIQNVFDSGSAAENGLTKRPLSRSVAASVVRASATP